MSWTFSFGSYQDVNKSHEIAQRKKKKEGQEQNLLKPETLALELAPLLPITRKTQMPIDFTFIKPFTHTKARASTKLVRQPPLPSGQHTWT